MRGQLGAEAGVAAVVRLAELAVVVGSGGGGTSKLRRQVMNCSSPNSASVCALSLPCSAP